MATNAIINVDIAKIVGRGYGAFWRCKKRYRVVKGSRRSKKSKTTALWFIYNLMKYPLANLLVVRKTFRTLKDSCFTELKWAAKRLQVEHLWSFKESPLEATYLPTGQKIYFRGLDDPLKITSITCEVGVIAWLWIEEGYEIYDEGEFDTLAESMLGDCPEGLFKQITITFNPWNERHWLKKRFFDPVDDEDIFAITTNYLCNEWLSADDLKVFEKMRIANPRRYRVAGLGEWGDDLDGLIYENWEVEKFDIYDDGFRKAHPTIQSANGLDFGYTNDPTAGFIGLVDQDKQQIFVWDEIYQKGLSNKRIYDTVKEMGYIKEAFTGDSAEPKSIDELSGMGMRIKGAEKGKDSINNGIQWIQNYEIIVHPRCVNFITEIGNYTWSKDKLGNKLNKPIDDFNHLMDAMRYGLGKYMKKNRWLF